jgi:peptidoglycan/LPS O-acetylase OafA/YrhL
MNEGSTTTLFASLLAASMAIFIWALWHSLKSAKSETAESAFEQFKSVKYFSGLDALRAISVIAVIWTHVSGPHAIYLLNQGNRGVDLFFAISGFLITTLLLREYNQHGRISLYKFYIRRTLRIFPLYYAALFLYCALVYFTLPNTPKGAEFWNNLPAFATYTTNWFVNPDDAADRGVTFYFAWSLAAEEQFYLFWPPVLMLALYQGRKMWAPAIPVLLILALKLWVQVQANSGISSIVFESIPPAILLGVLFGILLNSKRTFCALWVFLGNKLVAPAAAVSLLALLQLQSDRFTTNFVMALFVAAICIRENTLLHPILRWRPAVFVGTISYGIYLMHMLAANIIRKMVGHSFGTDVFVCTTVLVILLAYLSYRYFESPLLLMARRITAKPSRRIAPA